MSVWTWHCAPSLPERARPQGQVAALCSPPALLVGVGQKREEMGSFRASCSSHRWATPRQHPSGQIRQAGLGPAL